MLILFNKTMAFLSIHGFVESNIILFNLFWSAFGIFFVYRSNKACNELNAIQGAAAASNVSFTIILLFYFNFFVEVVSYDLEIAIVIQYVYCISFFISILVFIITLFIIEKI